jgi:RNA polymerase sigma factor (sigma-70 family)
LNVSIDNRDHWKIVWEKFKTGDRQAFDEIYQEFADQLFAYGAKITTDHELLKDCIQDLFIDLYRYNKNMNTPEYLEFYLFKSLRRLIIKHLKKENKLTSFSENEHLPFNLKFDLEDDLIQHESENARLTSLQQLLQSLDPQKRELLFLKFNSGLSYVEIGGILDLKPDTVKKQVYRLLDYLREHFGAQLMELFIICFRT